MKIQFWVVPAIALLTMGSAHAAACTGSNAGTASTADVTFASAVSDQCVGSGVNPQQGSNGNTSGFDSTFGTGWSLLGKVTGSSSASVNGVNFAWTFSQLSDTTGTWSLTTDKNATFDLVFAMHASNRSDAFLFDNRSTVAHQVNSQTWAIHWLNNGGETPAFSNLTLFERNVAVGPAGSPVPAVPEPETYALMLGGLGALGFMARRRKSL